MNESQLYLDKIAADDQFGFLQNIEDNYASHRPLLYLCLSLCTESDSLQITEMGSGESSTPYLRRYCLSKNLIFNSFDNNKDWCNKTGATYIENWDADQNWAADKRWKHWCALLFIDHAPGEHRRSAIFRMANVADIIVIHDTELKGGGDYKVEAVMAMFTHALHYNRTGGGAGASAVSNTVDLSRFKGLSLGKYKFE